MNSDERKKQIAEALLPHIVDRRTVYRMIKRWLLDGEKPEEILQDLEDLWEDTDQMDDEVLTIMDCMVGDTGNPGSALVPAEYWQALANQSSPPQS